MINPLFTCGNDVESTEHFLLHCPQFVNERRTLQSTLGNFNYSLIGNISNILVQTLLFGMEICHLVQALTLRFLLLQSILSEQLF